MMALFLRNKNNKQRILVGKKNNQKDQIVITISNC